MAEKIKVFEIELQSTVLNKKKKQTLKLALSIHQRSECDQYDQLFSTAKTSNICPNWTWCGIARFLSCSYDLTDDIMCGSIDEITKGSAITTALSSDDWGLWASHGSCCGNCSCSCSYVFVLWCWVLIVALAWLLLCLWVWYLPLPLPLRWLFITIMKPKITDCRLPLLLRWCCYIFSL